MSRQILAFGSAVFLVGIATADIGVAQDSASGCLNRAGQLSRVQIGEEPLGGTCPPNQQEVRLLLDEQTSGTLTINEEVSVGRSGGRRGSYYSNDQDYRSQSGK